MNTRILIVILLVKNPTDYDYSPLTQEMESSDEAPKFKVGDRVKAKFPSKIDQDKYRIKDSSRKK